MNTDKTNPASLPDGAPPAWLERPEVRRFLWRALFLACILSLIAECYVHRKGHFGFDGSIGFFAILGFGACAASLFLAKGLGRLLRRPENYYGELPAEKPADLDSNAHHDRA